MKRLTPKEWAVAKGPMAQLSPVGDDARLARMAAWLDARPGDGWFYVSGSNFHFGSQADAAAFRRWVTAGAD